MFETAINDLIYLNETLLTNEETITDSQLNDIVAAYLEVLLPEFPKFPELASLIHETQIPIKVKFPGDPHDFIIISKTGNDIILMDEEKTQIVYNKVKTGNTTLTSFVYTRKGETTKKFLLFDNPIESRTEADAHILYKFMPLLSILDFVNERLSTTPKIPKYTC